MGIEPMTGSDSPGMSTRDLLPGHETDWLAPMMIGNASLAGWQPIDTAPRDGTPVDLWIVGSDFRVDLYAPLACDVLGQPFRRGRATNWRWGATPPGWYECDNLAAADHLTPLPSHVRATHWMPIPAPPPLLTHGRWIADLVDAVLRELRQPVPDGQAQWHLLADWLSRRTAERSQGEQP